MESSKILKIRLQDRGENITCTICGLSVCISALDLLRRLEVAPLNKTLVTYCSMSCKNVYELNPLAYEGLGITPQVELKRLEEKYKYGK